MTEDLTAAVDALSSDDVFTRARAIATLQRNANEARSPTAAVLLDDESSEKARTWAAHALGQIGDDDSCQVVSALRKALRDTAPAVRWAALGALGLLGDGGTQAGISTHLHDTGAIPDAWSDAGQDDSDDSDAGDSGAGDSDAGDSDAGDSDASASDDSDDD